jgi:hypothetical protein
MAGSDVFTEAISESPIAYIYGSKKHSIRESYSILFWSEISEDEYRILQNYVDS